MPLYDGVKWTATAGGTGPLTVAGAVASFLTPEQKNVPNGTSGIPYTIFTATQREWGECSYNAGVITRDTVRGNSLGTQALINFTSPPTVFFDVQAEDLAYVPTAPLGSAAYDAASSFATAAQGAKADTAVQPGELAAVATTGQYSDLSGKPPLGTAAAENVGTAAHDVVQLDSSAKLPAVDGSQLTNLPEPAGANPTAAVGPAAVDGIATTFMRSDAAPALADTAVTPGSYTNADVTVDAQGRITAASDGSSAAALTLTDGTHTVADVAQITVSGATVGGTTPDATLTIPPVRQILTADTTFYVSTTGNDSNPGTSAAPWATLQHAVHILASEYDTAGFTVTISVGAGSFAGFGVETIVGGGIIQISGAGSLATTITNGPNDGLFNFGECFTVNQVTGATYCLDAVTLNNTVSNVDTVANYIEYQSILLGNYAAYTCDIVLNGTTENAISSYSGTIGIANGTLTADFTHTSSPATFIRALGGDFYAGGTIVLSGNPDFGTSAQQGFVIAQKSTLDISGATITGTSTGQSFYLQDGANLLAPASMPGNVPGLLDSSSTFNASFDPYFTVATPTTGTTVAMATSQHGLVLNPAGTLATLTINLPPSPIDAISWAINISSTKTVTALTVASTDSSTIIGAPSTLAADSGFSMIYDVANTTWYPVLASGSNPSPGPSVLGDLPTFSNTTGSLQDSGVLLSSLAPKVSPSFTTPALGVATGTSLALGGATIGSNALAVTGTVAFSSTLSIGGALTGVTTLAQSAAHTITESIGATSTDGLVLTNTTAASVGAQQWSPRIRLTGQGWKTASTAASQEVDWIIENQPQQGTAAGSQLVFSSAVPAFNSGAYVNQLTLYSSSASGNAPVYSVGVKYGIQAAYSYVTGANGNNIFSFGGSGTNYFGLCAVGNDTAALGYNSQGAGQGSFVSVFQWGDTTAYGVNIIPGNAVTQLGAAAAASPVAQTLQVQGSRSGTDSNVGGANLTIQPGVGTGTGTASSLIFKAPILAASGTGAQTQTLALTIIGAANGQVPSVVVGSPALATNATDGFLYIPTCAGTPTGTPTTQGTATVPLVFDTTDDQFWIYTGGAWKQPKTPAGAATVTWQ